jgi:small-conductance mechanosensitive channel
VQGRLFASAAVFAAYAASDALLTYARLSPEFTAQIVLVRPLLIAFGVINALVALIANPWREDRLPDRFPTIVQDAIAIALYAVAAVIVLQEKVLTTTAVGAVVIGFALQDTLGNLFAGLAIQIEKPFRVGNWVNVAGKDGMVTEITWRATKIRTKAGNLVIVPNSALARETITNYSEPNPHTRLEIEVGASYDSPPNEVKAAILSALEHEPLISHERPRDVLAVDFSAYAITYRVRVWTDDFAADDQIRDRIRSLIYYVFRRRGITIPYPIQVQIRQKLTSRVIDHTAIAAAVGAVEVFGGLSDEQRDALARASPPSVYSAGEVIVRQDEAGSSMFIVVSGEAVVTLEPSKQEVSRVAAGGFFGEMSLLTGAARTATVTATSDCELLEITADAFRQFVLANPAVVEEVGLAVAKRAAGLAELRTASEASARGEPPSSFIARARRFLRLSATVLALSMAWPAHASAADLAPMQLPSADGRRVVTAIDARTPITLDGALDEEVWHQPRPSTPAAD